MRVAHTGEFLANTDRHVQYMLPDAQHMVDIYVYSQMVRCAVIRKRDYHTMQEISVRFDKCPTWMDIVWGFSELAQKKYAKDMFQLPRRDRR